MKERVKYLLQSDQRPFLNLLYFEQARKTKVLPVGDIIHRRYSLFYSLCAWPGTGARLPVRRRPTRSEATRRRSKVVPDACRRRRSRPVNHLQQKYILTYLLSILQILPYYIGNR